jgi:cytochrome d ubiquinol oxidase subunit I
MDDLLAARFQMAVSLGFHIIFASIGMAMPFLMAAAHYRWLRDGDEMYRVLTKAWSRGVAIFFAVGAVSGTVLSFELGLLWPRFMEHAGPIIGLPFSWEGTAFFIEAIALGLFLYGWDRLHPWVHWTCGLVVGLSGVASAFFVIAANGWMNSPSGVDWIGGEAHNIRPLAAMFNDAFLSQSVHMTIAAFIATGFAVAGVHALLYLRGAMPRLHLAAIRISIAFAAVAALLQPLSGDLNAKRVAVNQPEKFAAMESVFHTTSRAPLIIGGIPSEERETVSYALRIPGLLSFLTFGDVNAPIVGLNEFPPENRPPVAVVHIAYQIMIFCGVALAIVGLVGIFALLRRPRLFERRSVLLLLACCTPLGFLAIEAGWTVTEVGRQPWIIYHVMRTSSALTPMPGLAVSFSLFTAFYLFLSGVIVWLMVRQVRALHSGEAL